MLIERLVDVDADVADVGVVVAGDADDGLFEVVGSACFCCFCC